MKPKSKPIKDLFFRFIRGSKYESSVSPQALAVVLADKGFIKLLPHPIDPIIEYYIDDYFTGMSNESQIEIADKYLKGLENE